MRISATCQLKSKWPLQLNHPLGAALFVHRRRACYFSFGSRLRPARRLVAPDWTSRSSDSDEIGPRRGQSTKKCHQNKYTSLTAFSATRNGSGYHQLVNSFHFVFIARASVPVGAATTSDTKRPPPTRSDAFQSFRRTKCRPSSEQTLKKISLNGAPIGVESKGRSA